MTDIVDPNYLQIHQYKDATHLNARIQLHQRYSTNKYGWFRWVFDQFALSPAANILELGCGPGTLWYENKSRIPGCWSIYLTDFSNGMLKQTRTNLDSIRLNIFFEVSNAMALPFRSQTFDAVIANHMLYHVPELQKTFAEIHRVLKEGSCLYASTNGENHLRELDQLMDQHFHFGEKSYSTFTSAASFTLDNGTPQLSPWFSTINLRLYEDSLCVTDAISLLAYMLSMIPIDDLPNDPSFIPGITAALNHQIFQHGAIDIQKSIGMFICQK